MDVSATSGPLLDAILQRATSTTMNSYQPPYSIASIPRSSSPPPANTITKIAGGESISSVPTSTTTATSMDNTAGFFAARAKPTTNNVTGVSSLDHPSPSMKFYVSGSQGEPLQTVDIAPGNITSKPAASSTATTTVVTTNPTDIKLTLGGEQEFGVGAHRSLFGTSKRELCRYYL